MIPFTPGSSWALCPVAHLQASLMRPSAGPPTRIVHSQAKIGIGGHEGYEANIMAQTSIVHRLCLYNNVEYGIGNVG